MPRSSPGASGRRVSTALRPSSRCCFAVSRGCGGRASGRATRSARPSRRIRATRSGRVFKVSLMRCASAHSRRLSWPRSSSQRSDGPSPRPCNSACSVAQSALSSAQASMNSCATWRMAWPRLSRGCRSTSRSRCHSSVRNSCSVKARAPWQAAAKPSLAAASRSAALAGASPKSASAGGSLPCSNAACQRCRSLRRCAVGSCGPRPWPSAAPPCSATPAAPAKPALQVRPGSHSTRGNAAKRS